MSETAFRATSIGLARSALTSGVLHRLFLTTYRNSCGEMEDDPFDSLLRLEDQYYKNGHDLGVKDGRQAGLIEGRLFGLEKGFEKYAAMGNLHGRAIVWAQRLPAFQPQEDDQVVRHHSRNGEHHSTSPHETIFDSQQATEKEGQDAPAAPLLHLPAHDRLEKHVRTFYALVEPNSISTDNNEESVSGFDDRLKRAEGKIKIIEKMIGEGDATSKMENILPASAASRSGQAQIGEANIEDITSLH